MKELSHGRGRDDARREKLLVGFETKRFQGHGGTERAIKLEYVEAGGFGENWLAADAPRCVGCFHCVKIIPQANRAR